MLNGWRIEIVVRQHSATTNRDVTRTYLVSGADRYVRYETQEENSKVGGVPIGPVVFVADTVLHTQTLLDAQTQTATPMAESGIRGNFITMTTSNRRTFALSREPTEVVAGESTSVREYAGRRLLADSLDGVRCSVADTVIGRVWLTQSMVFDRVAASFDRAMRAAFGMSTVAQYFDRDTSVVPSPGRPLRLTTKFADGSTLDASVRSFAEQQMRVSEFVVPDGYRRLLSAPFVSSEDPDATIRTLRAKRFTSNFDSATVARRGAELSCASPPSKHGS